MAHRAGEIRVVMPQLGESIVEATLTRWLVQAGDRVSRGQVLAEVETDKATNEIPAPADGLIGAILVSEGRTVPVGTVLLQYGTGAAEAAQAQDAAPPAPATIAKAPPPAPREAPIEPRTEPRPGSPAQPPPEPAGRLPSRHLADRGRALPASPAVRKIAREHGIAIGELRGTGRGGRVTREDILARLAARASPAAPAAKTPAGVYRPPIYEPAPEDRVVPFSRRRSFIAEHMVHSLHTAAHVAAVVEIDMSAVLKTKQRDQAAAEERGVKLTLTAYAVAAVARALAGHPEINASVVDGALVLRDAKNIGVAVDTEEGLVVPVIRRADRLDLFGVARALDDLSSRARAGKLSAEDVSGGSFTISNPGRDGNLFGISIIREPEVAILRLGEIRKRAVVREIEGEDAIVIRPVMFAALSYDHRVIDGRTGNAFLHEVRELLESGRASGQPAPAI